MSVFFTEEMKQAVWQYYDMLIEQVEIPFEKMYIDTRFGKTFVLAAGSVDAAAMVLVHGSSMNSSMWLQDMKKYTEKYRVYAVDMPGEPGRSEEVQLPFDTEDYTNWLLDVFHGLQLDSVVLAGASLGAWLAVKFAIAHPEKVIKLVLLCPAGIGSQNHGFKEIALSLLSKGEEGVDELFAQINGGVPIPEIMLRYQKLIAAGFNSRKEEIPLFSDSALRCLTMSGIVFVGDKDIMLRSDETAKRLARLVPHITVVRLPDKGHSLTGLADEILSFIN